MHALVVGGGIAGTTTAIALEKAGIAATVFEAYDHDAEGVGSWLTLAGNGIDALATLGLGDVVAAAGFATPRMRLTNHTGRTLAEFGFGAPRADGLAVHSVRRAELYRGLRDAAAARGVDVRYGKRLAGAAPTGDGVRAEFADGTHAEGDLLVGADGLRSTVRTLIDPQAPRARYGGLLNTGGFARGPGLPAEVTAEPGLMRFCFGRRCFLGYVPAPDGEVWWFANPPSARELGPTDLAAIGPQAWRARLLELFASDDLPAAALIDATDDVAAGWNTYDFPTVPTWHRDQMIIIGDAAHAMSPAAGQGASMALEDAVTLARALRDQPTVPAAFADHERRRRARVEKVVAYGKRNGDGKAAGPLTRVLRDRVIMPVLAARAARTAGAHPDSWLFDHHIDWVA